MTFMQQSDNIYSIFMKRDPGVYLINCLINLPMLLQDTILMNEKDTWSY